MTAVTHTNSRVAATLTPRTAPAPGQPLWGDEPVRQPIAPLILMAVLLLLVAAPGALAGGGGSANPAALMRDVAETTYKLTGLMSESNESLATLDQNTADLVQVQTNLGAIAASTEGMSAKTRTLNASLGDVGGAVGRSRERLGSVDTKLTRTQTGMADIRTNVSGSLGATRGIVREFGTIETSIGQMDRSLKVAIGEMARSAPLTKDFANNRTRVAIAGGDPTKYGVPSLAPDNRVMSVVLPMIATMQKGGSLPARKDRHEASNPIVGTALRLQVPDGTNVVAVVRPYDGFYGLPDENFFVQHRIHGF